MRNILKSAKVLAAVAVATTTFSFAGPGMADGGAKFLGNITTGGQVRSDFGQYWNQITAENECKWGSINTAENQYNWSGCDRAYNWAKQNGGHFKFHALVWGSQYPNWITSLSAERTKEVIEKWMKAVADHYNPMGGIEMIDVVNEAICTGGNNYHSGYTKTKIIEALGGHNGKYTFVAEAFKMARKYFPNSILIYNDYNTIQWNIDQGIDLIKQIKAQGAPVDAYGQQSHDVTNLGKSQFESALKKIHDAVQIPLIISEYDIEQIDDQKQKNDYANQIPFLWETEWIAGITLWGYIYGQTWLNCNGQANGCSGLIKNGQDRPAMTWLKQYFKENLAKGKNTTGIGGGEPAEPPPEPTPYKDTKASVPGKIEMENYDVGGSMSGFSDSDYDNRGDANVRADEGVDLVKGGSGVAVGYTATGEWLHFTIDVKTAGDYFIYANVSSGAENSGFQLQLDGKDAGSAVTVPKTGEDWSVYKLVEAGKVTLTAGTHKLKVLITGDNCNIDYLQLSAEEIKEESAGNQQAANDTGATTGDNGNQQAANDTGATTGDNGNQQAADNNGQAQIDDGGNTFIGASIKYDTNALQDYYVFDQQGVRMGILSAYGFDAAAQILRTSSTVKNSGVYYLRNRYTGKMQAVRVAR
ncbi:MAG: endo-1,4-beta-xylanase [Fibrobacter sp.]|nr:endo-1,4-beta-xylanase [Fibrobacter sp.]